jgi:hypothetical protein
VAGPVDHRRWWHDWREREEKKERRERRKKGKVNRYAPKGARYEISFFRSLFMKIIF